tara:strand:- start:1272 stop:1706 length:435 start_codon:yes stop_codon:yes gene_type:complete
MLFLLLPILLLDTTAAFAFDVGTDHQFYKPMVADIGRPYNQMRWYKGAKPKFGSELWTPQILGYFLRGTLPILSLEYGDSDYVDTTSTNRAENYGQMRTKATDMFLTAGAHMLLDFHSRSNAVLNTDFRIGGGFRGRLVERNDW